MLAAQASLAVRAVQTSSPLLVNSSVLGGIAGVTVLSQRARKPHSPRVNGRHLTVLSPLRRSISACSSAGGRDDAELVISVGEAGERVGTVAISDRGLGHGTSELHCPTRESNFIRTELPVLIEIEEE